jgi:hypothetical protein
VVRDDVRQLARDPRAFLHQRLVALRLVALGDRLAALLARVADCQRGDDDHEQEHGRNRAPFVVKGAMTLTRNGSANNADQRRL